MGVWQLFPISGFSRYTMGVGRMSARHKLKDKTMNKAKYKITIGEATTKGAKLANGGATVRAWGVVIINTETGDKQTAAQVIAAAAAKATDKETARRVKDMSRDFGNNYSRRTAAVLAAVKAAAALGDNYYLDRKLDTAAAENAEAVYIKAAQEKREAARARRLANMTPEQRKALERREAVKAVKARAAAEIDKILKAA